MLRAYQATDVKVMETVERFGDVRSECCGQDGFAPRVPLQKVRDVVYQSIVDDVRGRFSVMAADAPVIHQRKAGLIRRRLAVRAKILLIARDASYRLRANLTPTHTQS